MGKVVENQDKFLECMRRAVSDIEGEEFELKTVNLYHPWYTLFGDNFKVGRIVVMGNKDYMDKFRISEKELFAGIDKTAPESTDYRAQALPKWFAQNDEQTKSLVLKETSDRLANGEIVHSYKPVTNLNKYYQYASGLINILNSITDDDEYLERVSNDLDDIVQVVKPRKDEPVSNTMQQEEIGPQK